MAQLNVEDTNESFYIKIDNRKVILGKGISDEADVVLTTTYNVLRQIYEGKLNAITAAGKANYQDKAPLDWRFANNKKITPDTIARFNYLGMHFFNRSEPEKILLDEEHSRFVHGGHVIGLYYATGFRSAWYMLKKVKA